MIKFYQSFSLNLPGTISNNVAGCFSDCVGFPFVSLTFLVDSEYKHKVNIFPKEFNTSYEFDIQNNPQNYIKGMIYMCIEIEKIGTKSFQFFPLRNNIVLKYVPIDSKSLIELFIEEDKNTYLTDIENKKQELCMESIF